MMVCGTTTWPGGKPRFAWFLACLPLYVVVCVVVVVFELYLLTPSSLGRLGCLELVYSFSGLVIFYG
jgi:hypothetical protein